MPPSYRPDARKLWQGCRLLASGFIQKSVSRRSPGHIQALQLRRLQALVVRAKSDSPYHAERLRDIDPAHFELRQLPTLTKSDMMANFDRFLTDRRITRADLEAFTNDPGRLGEWYLNKYAVSRTSGSSGMQALIVQDRRMMELLFALQMMRGSAFPATLIEVLKRTLQKVRLAVVTIGRGFYPSAAALAYAPPAAGFFINRLWLQQIEPVRRVVTELNDFQPHILLAYANVLEILAREALGGRLRVSASKDLRQVINMSEPLSGGAKELIERVFGLAVTDNYATGECMALTTGCPQGRGMHLQADWAILEVVDRNNEPVPAGRPGDKVLLTNLYNTIQPFIRYEINDVVTMSPDPCPCGSPLPHILHVEGRTDELLWIHDADGFRQLHPYVFVDVLDQYPEVGWYQVLQTERNRFLLRASPAPGRQISVPELKGVIDEGLRHFGFIDLIQVDIEIAPDLAPNPESGKLKRITSRIGPPPAGAALAM
jgi:phenylacetate-coenzyme A ligase PaaK-like adenylate-forming protein